MRETLCAMTFAIIDFPHAVNTHSLRYALEAMLDQETIVVSATRHHLPEADVYIIADEPDLLQDTWQYPIMEALMQQSSTHKPLLVIGQAVDTFCKRGLLPGKLCSNLSGKFADKEIQVQNVQAGSLLSNQLEMNELLQLPASGEKLRWCIDSEQTADEQLIYRFSNEAQWICDTSNRQENIAAARSADGSIYGMVVRPERAVDDETGNTDGRKIFWSIIQMNR